MKTSDTKPPPKPTPREARDQRLAQALRDNLRRRKGLAPAKPSTEEAD